MPKGSNCTQRIELPYIIRRPRHPWPRTCRFPWLLFDYVGSEVFLGCKVFIASCVKRFNEWLINSIDEVSFLFYWRCSCIVPKRTPLSPSAIYRLIYHKLQNVDSHDISPSFKEVNDWKTWSRTWLIHVTMVVPFCTRQKYNITYRKANTYWNMHCVCLYCTQPKREPFIMATFKSLLPYFYVTDNGKFWFMLF